jgi:exodeoxyribonuclease VII large subunit
MLHRICQRFPRPVLLWPVLVQGAEAPLQVTEAIDGMNNLPAEQRPDLIIVARGGGSFEDLMPFNEENVVMAVARSAIPIISAIGHETDTTLVDYAADLRAPTPTAAAEFAVPEKNKLQIEIAKTFYSMIIGMRNNIKLRKLTLASAKILEIQGIAAEKTQKIDYMHEKNIANINRLISQKKLMLAQISLRKPIIKTDVENIFGKIRFLSFKKIEMIKNNFAILAGAMESNSHINILRKGFAFVESMKSLPISSAAETEKHQIFNLVFSDGRIKVKHADHQMDLL